MSYDRCVWRDNRLLALTVTELILKRFLTIQERKKFMSPQFCYEDFKSLEDAPHAPAEIRMLLKFLYQPYVESVRETTCLNTSYREFQCRYILEASTVLRHLTKLLDKLGGGAGAVGYRPPVYWTEEDERLRQEELARVKREYAVKAQRGREDALRRVRAHKGAIQFDLLSEEERQKVVRRRNARSASARNQAHRKAAIRAALFRYWYRMSSVARFCYPIHERTFSTDRAFLFCDFFLSHTFFPALLITGQILTLKPGCGRPW